MRNGKKKTHTLIPQIINNFYNGTYIIFYNGKCDRGFKYESIKKEEAKKKESG
jgi:hypothetical protein